MSQIKLTADSGGGTTSLKAPSSTTSNADVVLKLPVADGSSGQVLKTDGSGQLSFTSNAGTTINNNGSNRIITGSGTANTLEGESTFTYDGVNKAKIDTSQTYAMLQLDGNSGGAIEFYENGTRRFEIYGIDAGIEIYDRDKGAYHSKFLSGGDFEISDGSLMISDSIVHTGDTNTKIRFPANDNITMEVAGSEVFRVTPDAAHGSSQSIQLRVGHTIDGATVNMGGTKAYSAGIIRGQVNVRDAQAYNVTDNGGGIGFSAIYNNGGSHTTMSQIEGVKANNTDGNYRGAIKFSTRHHNGNMVEKVRIGQEGLSFEGATADANCIKDYEEGTWTPVIQGTGANNAKTYTKQLGKYTKIGNIVNCEFNLAWNSYSGNDSGLAIINGLPYTIDGNIQTGAAIGSMMCYGCNFVDGNGSHITAAWEAANSQNYIYPIVTMDNAAWSNPSASSFFPASGHVRGSVTYRVN